MLASLALYAAVVIVLAAGMLLASYLLGERHRDVARGEPYESGVITTGTARGPLSIKFYIVAMLFVIFDLEIIFLFAWAVAASELGWIGFAEVAVFVGVLVAGLAYLWHEGALDWGTRRRLKAAGRAPEGGSGS